MACYLELISEWGMSLKRESLLLLGAVSTTGELPPILGIRLRKSGTAQRHSNRFAIVLQLSDATENKITTSAHTVDANRVIYAGPRHNRFYKFAARSSGRA